MLRNKPIGPPALSLAGRGCADPHAMGNETDKVSLVVGGDHGYMADHQRKQVMLWKQKMMVIRMKVSGRVRQSSVNETHEIGGFSPYLLQSMGNSERNDAAVSEELMTSGYKRRTVRYDGEVAMVSHVRLAILATTEDGFTISLISRKDVERPNSWERLG